MAINDGLKKAVDMLIKNGNMGSRDFFNTMIKWN
jgi:hypothetical protein